jgi:hypothetical protein
LPGGSESARARARLPAPRAGFLMNISDPDRGDYRSLAGRPAWFARRRGPCHLSAEKGDGFNAPCHDDLASCEGAAKGVIEGCDFAHRSPPRLCIVEATASRITASAWSIVSTRAEATSMLTSSKSSSSTVSQIVAPTLRPAGSVCDNSLCNAFGVNVPGAFGEFGDAQWPHSARLRDGVNNGSLNNTYKPLIWISKLLWPN